jgi:hypothetical protein
MLEHNKKQMKQMKNIKTKNHSDSLKREKVFKNKMKMKNKKKQTLLDVDFGFKAFISSGVSGHQLDLEMALKRPVEFFECTCSCHDDNDEFDNCLNSCENENNKILKDCGDCVCCVEEDCDICFDLCNFCGTALITDLLVHGDKKSNKRLFQFCETCMDKNGM